MTSAPSNKPLDPSNENTFDPPPSPATSTGKSGHINYTTPYQDPAAKKSNDLASEALTPSPAGPSQPSSSFTAKPQEQVPTSSSNIDPANTVTPNSKEFNLKYWGNEAKRGLEIFSRCDNDNLSHVPELGRSPPPEHRKLDPHKGRWMLDAMLFPGDLSGQIDRVRSNVLLAVKKAYNEGLSKTEKQAWIDNHLKEPFTALKHNLENGVIKDNLEREGKSSSTINEVLKNLRDFCTQLEREFMTTEQQRPSVAGPSNAVVPTPERPNAFLGRQIPPDIENLLKTLSHNPKSSRKNREDLKQKPNVLNLLKSKYKIDLKSYQPMPPYQLKESYSTLLNNLENGVIKEQLKDLYIPDYQIELITEELWTLAWEAYTFIPDLQHETPVRPTPSSSRIEPAVAGPSAPVEASRPLANSLVGRNIPPQIKTLLNDAAANPRNIPTLVQGLKNDPVTYNFLKDNYNIDLKIPAEVFHLESKLRAPKAETFEQTLGLIYATSQFFGTPNYLNNTCPKLIRYKPTQESKVGSFFRGLFGGGSQIPTPTGGGYTMDSMGPKSFNKMCRGVQAVDDEPYPHGAIRTAGEVLFNLDLLGSDVPFQFASYIDNRKTQAMRDGANRTWDGFHERLTRFNTQSTLDAIKRTFPRDGSTHETNFNELCSILDAIDEKMHNPHDVRG